jgi:hypothetical protein
MTALPRVFCLNPALLVTARAHVLLDRDALGEVPGLVDLAAATMGYVVGEQLERDGGRDRGDQR